MLTRFHHHRSRALDIIVTVFLMLALSGCGLLRPRERIGLRRDTTIIHHRDSILRRDSVWVREYVKGDTVFIEKIKDRFLYRDRWRDSILVKRDSVTVYRDREVMVEKPLSAWQRFRIGAFWWLLAVAAAAMLYFFRIPLLRLIRFH